MLDRELRRRWMFLVVLACVAAVLEMIGAFGVLWLIGLVHDPSALGSLPLIGGFAGRFSVQDRQTMLVWLCVAIAFFYLVKNGFLAFQTYQQNKLPYDAGVRVSKKLLTYYLAAPFELHFARNSAELVRNIMNSVDVAFRIVLIGGIVLLSEFIVILAILVLLLMVSPVEALLAAGSLGAVAVVFLYLTQHRFTEWGRQVHDLSKELLQTLNQGIGAVKDVRILGREPYFIDRYDAARQRISRTLCIRDTTQAAPRLVLETVLVLIMVALIVSLTLRGGDTENLVPLLGLYAYAGFRLMPSLSRVTVGLQNLRYGLPSVEQVHADLVDARKLAIPPAGSVAPLKLRHEIRLDGITYTYPGKSRPAIAGIDLSIARGQSLGIAGRTGAGKSTLVDVLLGLLEPQAGRLLVDGEAIGGRVSAWQRAIGYVPQSPYMTDDTLRRNIAFGVEDAEIDEAAVVESIRLAQLEDVVVGLPSGLDTVIGERGVQLSGGQRQRIAIARALYHKPSLIVFDEATSAIDNLTEQQIADAVAQLAGSRTVVIVAHRDGLIRRCDRVVFMEEGRIAASGTFETLIGDNERFRAVVAAGSGNRIGGAAEAGSQH